MRSIDATAVFVINSILRFCVARKPFGCIPMFLDPNVRDFFFSVSFTNCTYYDGSRISWYFCEQLQCLLYGSLRRELLIKRPITRRFFSLVFNYLVRLVNFLTVLSIID